MSSNSNIERFQFDQYFISQKSLINTGKYYIQDENFRDILLAKSPIFQIKIKIDLYDEGKNQKYFTITQDRLFALFLSFTIKDSNGQAIGYIKRKISLFQALWEIFDSKGTLIGKAEEKIETALIDTVIKVNKKFTNFDIFLGAQKIGELERKLTIKDKYRLDLQGDPEKKLDRRLAVALAIVLDVGMGR